jgi:hypothetical protein
MQRNQAAGTRNSLMAETQQNWPTKHWSLQMTEHGTSLVPTTVVKDET